MFFNFSAKIQRFKICLVVNRRKINVQSNLFGVIFYFILRVTPNQTSFSVKTPERLKNTKRYVNDIKLLSAINAFYITFRVQNNPLLKFYSFVFEIFIANR